MARKASLVALGAGGVLVAEVVAYVIAVRRVASRLLG
jgi:hypothetical protein